MSSVEGSVEGSVEACRGLVSRLFRGLVSRALYANNCPITGVHIDAQKAMFLFWWYQEIPSV